MEKLIRILLVDDEDIVQRAVRAVLETESGMVVVGEAKDGQEALDQVHVLQPDVVLLDLMLPTKSGIQVIEEMRRYFPNVRILVLSGHSEDDKVLAAIRAGASGYLLKTAGINDMLRAIRDVYNGESWLHPTIARKLIQELNRPIATLATPQPLTDQETRILILIAQGSSNRDIAERLHISERTVRTHVSNILGKLHLENRTQAALYALKEGLAELGDESEKE
jgi:NarL family two-component system response regulator LiaR